MYLGGVGYDVSRGCGLTSLGGVTREAVCVYNTLRVRRGACLGAELEYVLNM